MSMQKEELWEEVVPFDMRPRVRVRDRDRRWRVIVCAITSACAR